MYAGELELLLSCVISDAFFGVQSDTYFVTENAGSVRLCAQLMDGCLQREVVIDYATLDATAESTSLEACLAL